MPSEDRVLRRADVLWRSTLDAVLIRPRAGGDVTKLAGTGLALWAALDEPTTYGDLCRRLAELHGVREPVVDDDIGPVIDELVRRGVVEDGVAEHGDGAAP